MARNMFANMTIQLHMFDWLYMWMATIRPPFINIKTPMHIGAIGIIG